MSRSRRVSFAAALALAAAASSSPPANAHCDGLDGPVVKAAREALSTGDVDPVLIWVGKDDEAEIRRAFERTLEVRKLGPAARELADTSFFETLVRVHRANEGAPFTGLKPAGRDLGPAIPAADHALESGNVAPLTNLLVERVRARLAEQYERARGARSFRAGDVGAGREYVERYVSFIHAVEAMYEAAARPVEGHYPDDADQPHQEP